MQFLEQLSVHEQNELASYHTASSEHVPGGSPFLSLTLNKPIAAYFSIGGMNNQGHIKNPNSDGKVYLSSINNSTTIYPVVAGKTKNIKSSYNTQAITDIGMSLSRNLNIPMGELLIVGGYYFHSSIGAGDAFQQSTDEFRTISDLYNSNLSFQMVEPIKGTVQFYNFGKHKERLEKISNITIP